ncbi:MAG TPA: hypothetical protein VH482_37460 [Thermomicrobiales bacterium]
MPTIHGRDEPGSGARLASRPLPSAEYAWYAGQRLAHEEWQAWAIGEAEKSRLLAEAKQVREGGRTGQRRGWVPVRVRSLRWTIGAALIRAGRRVESTTVAKLPEGTAR